MITKYETKVAKINANIGTSNMTGCTEESISIEIFQATENPNQNYLEKKKDGVGIH